MHLRYISVERLIAEAGGDPWAVDRSLQSGRPDQVSQLAEAFHDAGQSGGDAEEAFTEARRRFAASWNCDGDHPINDSAEVRRALSMGIQVTRLSRIAVDLERVAAVLAEAQRAAGGQTRALEHELEVLDRRIGELLADEDGGFFGISAGGAIHLAELEQHAVEDTVAALQQLEHIRDVYSELLHLLGTRMRARDGYDLAPVIGLGAREALSPGDAEADVHAALAGDQAAAGRVNAVLNSITAEQRAGKAPLTDEQSAVLSQLQAQQHGMSMEALATAEQRLGDQRAMIANSWQLMSNSAIRFPRTELKPGALQGNDAVQGGLGLLPESVRQALERPWLACDSHWFDFNNDLIVLGDIVKQGNPAFQTNTELDRRMIRKASESMATDVWQLGPDYPGAAKHWNPRVDQAVSGILAAMAPDHQVVHDFMTGPDQQTFLTNITHHFWSDHGEGAAALFNWTETAAHGNEAGLAGATASAYATFVGLQGSELLQLPGHHTLGEMNPKLVEGMAHGLVPYMNNIAGLHNGLPEFAFDPKKVDATDFENGRMPVAKGIFAVLSSDGTASDYFNGAADRHALISEAAYAQAIAGHAPNMDSYNENLHDAMTLRGLVNSGIHTATHADVENHHTSEEESELKAYNSRKTAYELAAKAVGSAVGFVPGAGAIESAGIGLLGGAIENDVIGPAPTGHLLSDHPLPDMPLGQADREILNAVIASGQHVPIAPEYLIDGRIANPDELALTPRGFIAGEYDQALSRAFNDLFRQNYGDGPDLPRLPDQQMIDRYDAVIKDPNPLKK